MQQAGTHVVLDVAHHGGRIVGMRGNRDMGHGQALLSTQCSKPALTHQGQHLRGGAAPVAVRVLHLHGQLGKGLAKFGDEHDGVETKTVAAAQAGVLDDEQQIVENIAEEVRTAAEQAVKQDK